MVEIHFDPEEGLRPGDLYVEHFTKSVWPCFVVAVYGKPYIHCGDILQHILVMDVRSIDEHYVNLTNEEAGTFRTVLVARCEPTA